MAKFSLSKTARKQVLRTARQAVQNGENGEPNAPPPSQPRPASFFGELPWIRFQSSNVWGAAYLPDFERLFIRFHSGAIYKYESYPAENWGWFKNAPSKGKFVYYSIRGRGSDSHYPFERVA